MKPGRSRDEAKDESSGRELEGAGETPVFAYKTTVNEVESWKNEQNYRLKVVKFCSPPYDGRFVTQVSMGTGIC